jgi:hypothetical protein
MDTFHAGGWEAADKLAMEIMAIEIRQPQRTVLPAEK